MLESLLSTAALIIANLPNIIKVATDITTVVNAMKAGDSVYEAIKAKWPEVTDVINQIAKVFPKDPLVTEAQHLEGVAKVVIGAAAWSEEQKKVLKPYLPENTGGGSVGYNQQATSSADE